MVYLIYSSQITAIKSRIKKIATESLGEIDDINFIRFSFDDTSLDIVLDECAQTPLGYDKKVISLENFSLINEETKKVKEDKLYIKLIDFIKNKSPEVDLILSVVSNKVDEKSELYKAIEENGKLFSLSEPTGEQWKAYCYQFITTKLEAVIDHDALIELAERTEGDALNFQNHARKLAIFTNHITLKDVKLMVERQLEDNIFELYKGLIYNNKELALSTFHDMKVNGEEPIALIAGLSKQFRIYHEVMHLTKSGKSVSEVAKIVGIAEKKAIVNAKQAYLISEEMINQIMDDLYNLDLQIKSGLVDRYYAFELFLINFKTK